ncbi:hypothetical protein FWD20_02885 [Candidatus Saccharibacteria bacterium]|nr:hypothetical protein [Candidatus Saccharibacteria bacterium]
MKRIFEQSNERGESKLFVILTGVFGVLMIGLGVGFFWAFTQMNDYRTDVDGRVSTAVEAAKTEQRTELENEFDERYQRPNVVFTGPANFGSVTFEHPRTWSVYVENDGQDGSGYAAYFNPGFVPRIDEDTPYALRVEVINSSFKDREEFYRGMIENGAKLTATTVRLADASTDPASAYGKGVRLDGQFRETINGAAVLFDIRGRTLAIYTDKQNYVSEFNNILKTLKYND